MLYSFHDLNQTFTAKNKELVKKERLVQEIGEDFNQTFMDVRGYLAIGNKEFKIKALNNEPRIRELTSQLGGIASDYQDRKFLDHIVIFTDYYFVSTLPDTLENYERGNYDAVVEIANSSATYRINSFKKEINAYIKEIDKQIDQNFQELTKIQSYMQIGFVSFILVFLIVLLRIIRIMFSEIAHPLASFASAEMRLPVEGMQSLR